MLHPQQQHIVDIYGKQPSTLNEVAEACVAVLSADAHNAVGFAWEIKYSANVSNSHSAPIDGATNWGARHKTRPTSYPGFTGRVWVRYRNSAKHTDYFGSDLFSKTLTYTGTGGAGAYRGIFSAIYDATAVQDLVDLKGAPYPRPECFSYDYRFFLADFPLLESVFNEEKAAFDHAESARRIWHKLQGRNYCSPEFALHHQFQWEDPVTKAADLEFLQLMCLPMPLAVP